MFVQKLLTPPSTVPNFVAIVLIVPTLAATTKKITEPIPAAVLIILVVLIILTNAVTGNDE